MVLSRLGALLTMLLSLSLSASTLEAGSSERRVAQETQHAPATEQGPERPRGTVKITVKDCEIRGGEFIVHPNPLPEDLVDCLLPAPIRRLGGPAELGGRQVLASAYDYLYRAGTERPGYGLYSYVLFPVASRRAERFLEELFKTTSFVEVTGISLGYLNVMYLPTRAEKLSALKPVVVNGLAPSVGLFSSDLYDYRLAQRLLVQICAAPAGVIRSICRSDLSRGPYLFTYASPASTLSRVPPPYLVLDLSRVHERAFGEFVSAYKAQVKREDFTDLERIANLRLRLLSTVLTAADWMDPIKGAMADIVHLAGRNDPPQ